MVGYQSTVNYLFPPVLEQILQERGSINEEVKWPQWSSLNTWFNKEVALREREGGKVKTQQ